MEYGIVDYLTPKKTEKKKGKKKRKKEYRQGEKKKDGEPDTKTAVGTWNPPPRGRLTAAYKSGPRSGRPATSFPIGSNQQGDASTSTHPLLPFFPVVACPRRSHLPWRTSSPTTRSRSSRRPSASSTRMATVPTSPGPLPSPPC